MDNISSASSDTRQAITEAELHVEQLKRVELINGRAAMLGIVIGIVVEGLTGFGIAHQIGLGFPRGWLRRLPHQSAPLLLLIKRESDESQSKRRCD
jgi:hypothetical protein